MEARGRGYCPRAAPFAGVGAPETPGCPSLPGDLRNEPKQTVTPSKLDFSPASSSWCAQPGPLSTQPSQAQPEAESSGPVLLTPGIAQTSRSLSRKPGSPCASSRGDQPHEDFLAPSVDVPTVGARERFLTPGGSGQGGTQPDAEPSSPIHTIVQILGLCLLAPRVPPIQSKGETGEETGMDPRGGGAWPTPTRSLALKHMDAQHPVTGRRQGKPWVTLTPLGQN